MGLNCLAIACSPRKKGNTSILAQKALEGCRDAGGKTEFLYLVDYNYVPCRACGGCDTTGKCVIKDDSAELFEKILACDRLILAAPIFSMGICAQAKSFIDRSQQFWAYKFLLGKKLFDNSQRKGIFISCAGTKLPHVFDGALQVARYFFMIMEIELAATACYRGIDNKGDVYKSPEILEEVYDMGRKLVK
ncbi:MAG: flavodoxin family protein [Thermacetogeniaceae bacterium]